MTNIALLDAELEVIVPTRHGRIDTMICHEPADDESDTPACGWSGKYRRTDVEVFHEKRHCTKDGCWDDGVPDLLQTDD